MVMSQVESPVVKGGVMQAIVQDGYGTPEVLRLAEIDRPTPGADEVLIQVRAAGVDRGTWHVMAGQPYAMRLAIGLRRPRNPVAGMDVAGTVVEVGAEVTGFAVGDEVFGVARGSFAEYARAKANAVARKPAGLSFEQAAVIAVSGATALQGLRDVGRVQVGQRVLIIGASGGVGTYAVQLAKAFGAMVIGVCSTAKVDLVRSLGADHVVDYTRSDAIEAATAAVAAAAAAAAAEGGGYDLILDIGGNTSVHRLRRALAPRGTLVIVGGEDSGNWLGMSRQLRTLALSLSPFVHERLTTFVARSRQADLESLSALIDAGKVVPIVGATYPLADVPEAIRRLRAGMAPGKLAITI